MRLSVGPWHAVDDRSAGRRQAGLLPKGAGTSTPGMVAYPIDVDAVAASAVPELETRPVTDAAGIHAHRQTVTGRRRSPLLVLTWTLGERARSSARPARSRAEWLYPRKGQVGKLATRHSQVARPMA